MEHPIKFPEPVDDTLNGRNSRQVDFVDVGCGFGGLLSKKRIFLSKFLF